MQQCDRGVVQNEKVGVKESPDKVSRAGICESICTRGETRIFTFCLVRVSRQYPDRYVGTEPVSRHSDAVSRGVTAVPITTAGIDSFKQARYGCAASCSGAELAACHHQNRKVLLPPHHLLPPTQGITQGATTISTQPEPFVFFPLGFCPSPESNSFAWGSEDTTDSTK